MSETTALTILGLMTLIINYTSLLLLFPRRFNKLVSICLPILFTAFFYTILLSSGTMVKYFGGFRGFVHLPLILILIRGQFFQKLFCVTFQMLLVGFQLAVVKVLAETFVPAKSEQYYMLCVIFTFVFFTVYVFLVAKFGQRFVIKLFASARWQEWALYSFGALFSFAVFAVTIEMVTNTLLYLLVMAFTIWSFCILCFAIVNTHEKTKQRYDAEFAKSIISTGSDHYQKMNEMYDKLRILRHDYKYHLSATREMLRCGDSVGADNYLTDVETNLAEHEFLPNYCQNSVINALVAGYAERASKIGINFDVDISILKTLPVPNYEMCIIIGNLLENAIEACGKLDNDRTIELAAKSTHAQFMLMVKNSFDGAVAHNEEAPISTKPNGGVGLQSVKAVAVRHGGDLFTEWDKDTFTAYVTVRL